MSSDSVDGIFDNLTSKKRHSGGPSPEDLVIFLPWACQQLQLNIDIIFNVLHKYAETRSTTGRSTATEKKQKKGLLQENSSEQDNKSTTPNKSSHYDDDCIKICIVYDNLNNVIQLKFDKCYKIPRTLLKIIALIVNYHPYLTGITINKGIDAGGIYELNKLLLLGNVTDICLDNTVINNPNYDLLLEKNSNLRQLSLARCKITDDVLKNIALKLIYPLPASKTLSLLNLTSNAITDLGAKHLAVALRSNRKLVYINLSDNMITDDGFLAILDVLYEFPVLDEEILLSRKRKVDFLKAKNELIDELAMEIQSGDFDKKYLKRKSVKPNIPKKTKVDIDPVFYNSDDVAISTGVRGKAKAIAETKMGDFRDPFSTNHIYHKDEVVYCYGNNQLGYLNISYNDISYVTVKKLLTILTYQKTVDRKPRGLVKVCIEGNCIPVDCIELQLINAMLTKHLAIRERASSFCVKGSKKNVL